MSITKLKKSLQGLKKEELIEILINICNEDKKIKETLIFEYVSASNLTNKSLTSQINKVIKRYSGRYDFIEYNKADMFVDDMFKILDQINKETNIKKNIKNTLLFLTKTIEVFQIIDDSSGCMSELVYSIFGSLKYNILEINQNDTQTKGEVFNELLIYSDNEVLDFSSDFLDEIFELLTLVADNDIMKKKVENKIYEQIEKAKATSSWPRSEVEALSEILLNIKLKLGTKEEAKDFLNENINLTSFRKVAVSELINQKDYAKALELVCEGEIVDKEYAGILRDWKNLKYDIYKKMGARDEQYNLALELYKAGDFKYYDELKALTTDKKALYNKLKDYEKQKFNDYIYSSQNYLSLILKENDLEALLEVVKMYPNYITDFADILFKEYKNEVIDIYEFFIISEADNSTDRKKYKKVCKLINDFSKYCDLKRKTTLIDSLLNKYAKRPAFIDELNKIR